MEIDVQNIVLLPALVVYSTPTHINFPLHFQGESGSDYSPNKLPHSVLAKSISPPPLRHRTLMHQRSGPATLQSKPTKFQTPRYPEEQALRQVKPVLSRSSGGAQTSTEGGRYADPSGTRDSSLGELRNCCSSSPSPALPVYHHRISYKNKQQKQSIYSFLSSAAQSHALSLSLSPTI